MLYVHMYICYSGYPGTHFSGLFDVTGIRSFTTSGTLLESEFCVGQNHKNIIMEAKSSFARYEGWGNPLEIFVRQSRKPAIGIGPQKIPGKRIQKVASDNSKADLTTKK